MVRRVARAALFGVTLLALWTLAVPAFAAPAPFCDDRGATAIAAPPALEAPDVAIRRAIAPTCGKARVELEATVGPSQRQPAPLSDAPAFVCAPAADLVAMAPPGSVPLEYSQSTLRPPAGAAVRIERPPRD